MNDLKFSERQAQAILDMRLQKLTGLEREKLVEEMTGLLADIARYRNILSDARVLDTVIRDELTQLKHKFGDERRTVILPNADPSPANYEDLIPEEDIMVTLSCDGYLRRAPLRNYGVQNRGGKGRRGAVLTEEDEVSSVAVTTTHSNILLFTSEGRLFAVKGHVIPETRYGKGSHISKFISLNENESVVALKGRNCPGCDTVILLTKYGITKRMEISELQNLTRAGRQIMTLDEGDIIVSVRYTHGTDELLLITRKGRGLRINEDEVRTMGRSARGVIAMRLEEGDEIISCEIVSSESKILLVSENGIGKLTSYDEFSVHHRATGGVRAMRIDSRSGDIAVAARVFEDDEVVLITSNGRMVRLSVTDIPLLGRNATGSFLMRPQEGDIVAGISLIHKSSLVENDDVKSVPLSKPESTKEEIPEDSENEEE